ncbi:MAG: haloacid dehalogenase type II [Gammaproteobacteria bacterium]|nr:haloacid dehalogenase type II [Gammaproteobacteria bacterium]
MTNSLNEYSVLTFDCYGTLIDWESGIWDALQPLLMKINPDDSASFTRDRVLGTFAKHESTLQNDQPKMPYPDLLANVHQLLADEFQIQTTEDMNQIFGHSVPHWPAFPDTADSLRELSKHYKLVILSNIDNRGFAASNRKLGVTFDAIYTAEMIGSYKPDDRNFRFMLEKLREDFGFERRHILHTAQSLHHDHVPARKHNLANAWIDRQNLVEKSSWGATSAVEERPKYDYLFPTLQAMANALQAELDREG